jgi:HlyD family secretion protein
MRSRWIRRLLLLGLLAGLVWGARVTLFRPVVVPVTVYTVERGRVEQTVTNSKAGTVRSRRRASLSPEMGGRVEMLAVRKGDRVKAGQVLMRLADAEPRAQVALQERALDAAAAAEREACQAAELAAREAERMRRLVEDGVGSPQALDQLETARAGRAAACDAARARVRQADAALALARVTLSRTVMRAPFDAVVADVSTEVGEWITPSPPGLPIPPVIDLIATDEIYVSAPLDEVDAGRVQTGLPVRVTLDALPGRVFRGRVARVASYVDDRAEQNRTIEIEVDLDDRADARSLVPGMSADVEIVLDAREPVLRVPTYALLQGDHVLVVRDDAIERVMVRTGLRNWDFVEIVEGLSAGDRVVVSLDRPEVREGARVRVEGAIGR